MSIIGMMPNTCDLYEMVAQKGEQGGNTPVPRLMASGLTCNVQSSPSGKITAYALQERMGVSMTVYFAQDIGITRNGNYRLVRTDVNPATGLPFNTLLQVMGYSETTLGRDLVWSADCSQVL